MLERSESGRGLVQDPRGQRVRIGGGVLRRCMIYECGLL